MSRQRNRFSTVPTAPSSMAFAFASLAVSACGGTGDRHPPENVVTSDAGIAVDVCNPSATLEMQLMGCSPNLLATDDRLYCPDFERAAVTNGKTEPDPLTVSGGWTFDTCKNAPPGTDCILPGGPGGGDMARALMDDGEGNTAHCGSGKYAYHMVARGQLRWGPQAYIQYDSGDYPPGPAQDAAPIELSQWDSYLWGLDISDWDGIAFWIRAGDHPLSSSTPTDATLVTGNATFVSLITPWTNGQAKAPGGSRCDTAADAPDPVKCDDFGFPVAYSENWEYKILPFSALKQRGFGVHEDKPDLKHVIQLKFGFEAGDYWNVWIDDISLWRKK